MHFDSGKKLKSPIHKDKESGQLKVKIISPINKDIKPISPINKDK